MPVYYSGKAFDLLLVVGKSEPHQICGKSFYSLLKL